MRPGEELQKLVRLVELGLSTDSRVKVHSPLRLKDKDTGRLREHDVVVEVQSDHHRLLIALECRDRSRKVSVPEVEAFDDKCRATGISQGIIVSSLGFTNTALSKARARGVRCLSLQEVAEFDWCRTTTMAVVSRNITAVNLGLKFAERAPANAADLVVFAGGKHVDRDHALAVARAGLDQVWQEEPLAFGAGEHRMKFEVEPDEDNQLVARVGPEEYEIAGATLTVAFTVVISQRPFLFGKYEDKTSGQTIADAAIAQFEVQGRSASLVITGKSEQEKVVKLIF